MISVRYGSTKKSFSHFGPFFALLPPPPPDNPENQTFKKLERMPGNIIIWDMCTINDNQMMYVSWDIEHYRQNFWSFWPRDTISLHMCAINDNHMMYRCWDMDHDWQFFVILDHFFCLLPPNNPKNQHFEKNEKKPPGCMTLKKNQKNRYHFTCI